jgi:uncharacterized protein YkwD
MLGRHNHWRARTGVPDLRWSHEIAQYAKEWANDLSRRGCAMQHRPSDGPFAQQPDDVQLCPEAYLKRLPTSALA